MSSDQANSVLNGHIRFKIFYMSLVGGLSHLKSILWGSYATVFNLMTPGHYVLSVFVVPCTFLLVRNLSL